MISAVRKILWTLRIALPKVAVGWMFALLTIDFNRVAIFEMGVAAVIVTTLLSVHYFLAPFQVIAGRIADCYPILGYRRSPYLIGASIVASLLFLLLPTVTFSMGDGSMLAMLAAIALFVLFGICMAVMADSYHSLLAEVTDEQYRPLILAVVWIVMILSTIFAAVVMNIVRPEFSPEAMQRLYNLTPAIVIISVIVGIIGVEKRLKPEALRAAMLKARSLAPPGNPLTSAFRLVNTNSQIKRFFFFIVIAVFGIFLHESVIEVFGAEVFGMSIKETTRFQPIFGGGVLLGMIFMGVVSVVAKVPKQISTLVGCGGAALCFVGIGLIAVFHAESLLVPALFALGFCVGIFNVGVLALMMDMTVTGATGLYMGLWGTAQAIGMGMSAVVAGALHTGLIDSGLMTPEAAYWLIFSMEAGVLVLAAYALYGVKLDVFKRIATGVSTNDASDDPLPAALGATGA